VHCTIEERKSIVAQFYYGGQAIIEGVMMRGRRQASIVVRTRGGDCLTHSELLPDTLYHNRVARLPFVRGLVMLWEMLILGTRMLLVSANVQARREMDREIPKSLVLTMMAFSLTFVVGLFFILPFFVSRAGGQSSNNLGSNLREGLLRLLLFVGYLMLVGRLSTMKRLFQYHGAEHKTINAFENGAVLEPATVQRYSTVHIRCGTAFMLWVLLISVLTFALLGHLSFGLQVASRIILIPAIASVSYELLRLGARYYSHRAVRIVLQPGLWLQKLTTREPDDSQVEVAIAALIAVLDADGQDYLAPEEPLLRVGAGRD
jgi:uncharacterized protein YqhQ